MPVANEYRFTFLMDPASLPPPVPILPQVYPAVLANVSPGELVFAQRDGQAEEPLARRPPTSK